MGSVVIRAVLYDLDGTLLDTAPHLVAALNHVRATEGMEAVRTDDFRRYVSQGALGLIGVGMPPSNEQVREARKSIFLEYYEQNLAVGTVPFEGVEPTLLELDRLSLPWGVVTNKPEYLTFPLLETIGWSERAGCVICGDTLQHSKPHPEPVLRACELLKTTPAQSLMVGDDPRDLEAGEAAGAHTAVAAYGYGAREILASGRPLQFVFERPQDIFQLEMPEIAQTPS